MSLPGYDVSCEICMYAAEHGSWPPSHRGTHCLECCRSWTAAKESHCPSCHLHFSTDNNADKHRQGGRCLTAGELRRLRTEAGKPILRVVDTPQGETWRSAETLRLRSHPEWVDA